MRRVIPFLVLLACSSSSKKDIAPEDKSTPMADGGTPPVPTTTSTTGTDTNLGGTRLKARTYQADDGAKQFLGFYDLQLQTNCTFQVAADGQTRCLPVSYLQLGLGFYSDTKCTVQLASIGQGCAAQSYIVTSPPVTVYCSDHPPGERVLVRGELVTTVYHFDSSVQPAACAVYDPTVPNGETLDFYSIGDEVEPSTFVAATESHD